MGYYDYFDEKEHKDGKVSMDEFIAEAMRSDLKFKSQQDELQNLRTARITLKNESLTCYAFMKEHNLLELYEAYRNGEELPFQ